MLAVPEPPRDGYAKGMGAEIPGSTVRGWAQGHLQAPGARCCAVLCAAMEVMETGAPVGRSPPASASAAEL